MGIGIKTGPGPLGWGRSLLFASGDFACNLYWQSITFYLLFFYTDTLGLSAAMAGLIVMLASMWDGLAGLLIGVAADRDGSRSFIQIYAVPLALSLVLLYLPVALHGLWLVSFALIGNLLFRTFYVAVNVPYAALTIRIAADSPSRSRIAGLRMILGGVAAFVVAIGTQASVTLAAANGHPSFGYAAAAVIFGVVATIFLFVVGAMDTGAPVARIARPVVAPAQILATIAGNRAFLLVNLGICGAAAAMGVLTRAVPYFFKYEVGDAAAGSVALAAMAVAGVIVVPAWMACAAHFGHRMQWLASALLAAIALGLLLALRPASALGAQALMVLFYMGGQGLFFGFWALMPDVVEHGAQAGSPRMDTMLFGVAALLQKFAQGVAVALFGVLLSASGYAAHAAQPAFVLDRLLLLSTLLPLVGMLVAMMAMLRFPRLRPA